MSEEHISLENTQGMTDEVAEGPKPGSGDPPGLQQPATERAKEAEPRKAEADFRSKAILAPEDMESRPKVRRAILMLAWPVIIEQILSMLTHMVDSAMVGRLGAEVVAGVNLSFQPMMLVNGVFGGIAMGNAVLVARSVGAGDRDTASRVAFQALMLAGMLALLMVVPGWIYSPKLISLMGRTTRHWQPAQAISDGLFQALRLCCVRLSWGIFEEQGIPRPMVINTIKPA